MQRIIKLAKNIRKQKYLKLAYTGNFAFVGIGNHSINNLYLVLNHLRVSLKYIVTFSQQNAATVNKYFSNLTGTNDLETVLADDNVIRTVHTN